MVLVAVSVYAVDSSKPSTHNSSWEYKHGQAAKANEQECLTCHEERLECISCHEDKAPRSHTSTFVNRTHGLESRWKKDTCQTCHREDFCTACHETAVPRSHNKTGFHVEGSGGTHCGQSCQPWQGPWGTRLEKNCLTCHKVKPTEAHPGK